MGENLGISAVSNGRGLGKMFESVKACGVHLGSLLHYEQVQAAISIRNCLVHSGGLLAKCREEKRLRKIQSTGKYLLPKHRKQRTDEVLIVDSDLGECLKIGNDYSYLATVYFRDCFQELCRAVDAILSKSLSEAVVEGSW
jgi:hypothetical protein